MQGQKIKKETKTQNPDKKLSKKNKIKVKKTNTYGDTRK